MKSRILSSIWIVCLFLVCSAFFCVLPVSADSGVAGTSYSKTVTYNNSESGLDDGNCFLRADTDYYYSDDIATDVVQSHFWYLGKRQLLFTSSADYYGYYISVSRTTKTTVDFGYATKNYWVVGTATDILNGQSVGGLVDSSSFTTWVQTDNSVQAIHMAPLFYMIDVYQVGNGGSDTYYKINCKYTITYKGYKTKSDYESAMSEISNKLDNIDSSIDESTDTITSGYDQSAGSVMNDNFSSSVDDYQQAEGSLFDAATSGMNDFEFINFTSYPALVTAMTFVTSTMSSIYIAFGGESGPIGIVLAVLFSVMLVSMVIGLYRFYQSSKK